VLRSSLFFRLRRERARLESLHGSSSETTQLLAEKLGLPPDEIGPMLDRLDTRDLSLDAPIYSDDGATLGDSLASHDDAELAYDAEKLRHRVEAALQKALPELDTGNGSLPRLAFFADTFDKLSLADIGRKLGVSRERARQLETRACAKIRRVLTDAYGECSDRPATAA
jgi:RNA polymerase sigma-32 factor